MSDDPRILTRPQFKRIEGVVWCDEHGSVHDDTTDPYDYGRPDCRKTNHRPVYVRRRKGDWRE